MKTLVAIIFIISSAMAVAQDKVGGGGDASELTVNTIRSDIFKWIQSGGSKDLKLPPGMTLNEYGQKMTAVLQPKFVVIGFVENDASQDEELRVSVNGMPKTCRGFISTRTNRPHILCHISRFENSTEAQQYQLIHHEYAGLAGVERNDDAASDYEISEQLADFLTSTIVLRLGIKDIPVSNCSQGKFCTGDVVFYGSTLRTVEMADHTGKVLLAAQSGLYERTFVTTREIRKITSSYGHFKVGQVVIHGNDIRTIQYMDTTGRVVLAAVSGQYFQTWVHVRELTLIVPRFEGFGNGDKVFHGNTIRTIQLVTSTGRVLLAPVSGLYYSAWVTNREITMIQRCTR